MSGSVQISKFVKNTSGATIIYVTMILAVLIGMAGMAVDFSRLHIAHTQAQAAADAAAIAAANQLDGSDGSRARAIAAAQNAMLIANGQDFADEGGTPEVDIQLRFLKDLPASDDLPITAANLAATDGEAEFAEATTELLTHRNVLLPFLNIAGKAPLRATAVAGQESAICRVTPFAICNPNEDPLNSDPNIPFDYTDWKGRQIVVKMAPGPSAAWAPGNFGFLLPQAVDPDLDAPENMGGMGAPAIANMLASPDGANQCFSAGLSTRTGQINGIRMALNTRFDMYGTPHFNQPADKIAYPPAVNVTKGYRPQPTGASGNVDPCDVVNYLEESPQQTPALAALPRDGTFTSAYAGAGSRFGDGNWDCAAYAGINHPNDVATLSALGCTSAASYTATDSWTRYDMYRWEIAQNKIPGTATSGPEEGTPQCSTATLDPFDPETDRRLVHFAVMNCIAEGVNGQADNIPAVAFVRAFMTEPVNGVDFDVFLEVVDAFSPGTNDGPLKEYVEIYR